MSPRKRSVKRHALELSTEGGTPQGNPDETNINNIMAKYQATGIQPRVTQSQPLYGDFSAAVDLHQSMNRVLAAQAHFDALPSRVRAAAGNDPVQFLAMFDEPDEQALLVEAGLEISSDEDLNPEPETPPVVPNNSPSPKPAPEGSTPGEPEPAVNTPST